MTTLPNTITPRSESGREEVIRFIRTDIGFIDAVLDSISAVEDGPAAIPVPQGTIYFIRTVLHAAGEEAEYADMLTRLSQLDRAIIDSDSAPGFAGLEAELQILKRAVIDDISRTPQFKQVPWPNLERRFDLFVKGAKELSASENFRVLAEEALPVIKESTELTRYAHLLDLREFTANHERQLKQEWARGAASAGLDPEGFRSDRELRELHSITARVDSGGSWIERARQRYESAAQTLGERGAFG